MLRKTDNHTWLPGQGPPAAPPAGAHQGAGAGTSPRSLGALSTAGAGSQLVVGHLQELGVDVSDALPLGVEQELVVAAVCTDGCSRKRLFYFKARGPARPHGWGPAAGQSPEQPACGWICGRPGVPLPHQHAWGQRPNHSGSVGHASKQTSRPAPRISWGTPEGRELVTPCTAVQPRGGGMAPPGGDKGPASGSAQPERGQGPSCAGGTAHQ